MRMPPSQVARSSQRSRPRTASATGRPVDEERAGSRAAARSSAARQAGVNPARDRDRRSSAPAACTIVARHVEAALRAVPLEVLPEVRELQRGADRVRRGVEPSLAVAGDAQHQPADRIGRSPAVVEQVGPGLVALSRYVLPERAQQIVEAAATSRSHRRIVSRERREDVAASESDPRTAARRRRREPRLPVVEQRQARVGVARAFVGEVVGHARKRVDRGDVRTRRAVGSRRDATGKFS